MMFVAGAIILHSFREVIGKPTADDLGKAIAQERRSPGQAAAESVEARLERCDVADASDAQKADRQEGVFSIGSGDVVAVAMHVLRRDGQGTKAAQNVTANSGQRVGTVGADIEGPGARLFGEGVQPNG